MPEQNEFEMRRRERRRRERLRRKRIRAVLLLILLIGVIVLICAAVSALMHGNSSDNSPSGNNESVITGETPVSPTEPPRSEITVSSSIPEPSQENNLIQIIADAGQTKRCYLTFDDGPTESITPQILDVLRRYNVKATFFEVGSLIESNPDISRRVYEEGHLIANHSDSHNYDKLYATGTSFITEITDCEEKIKNVMNGEEPFKLIRFPGGSYDTGDHSEAKQSYKELLAENGFYYCDWNSLIGDAEGRSKNAEELLAYFQANLVQYNNLIVLMHDATSKQTTVDVLPSLIEYISGLGYTFHRLDDIDYNPQSAE